MSYRLRFEPCELLRQNKIPCAVYFEDALGFYGVPTVIFDLFVLVPDMDEAAMILVKNGWTSSELSSDAYSMFNESPPLRHRRFLPPMPEQSSELEAWPSSQPSQQPPPQPSQRPAGPTYTFLLPASDWSLGTAQIVEASRNGFMLSLADLADSLIDNLLAAPDSTVLQRHLSVFVSYLYEYVLQLKEKSFADKLKCENRQFHLDCLADMAMGTIPFLKYERQIRESLKKGQHQLRDCSVARTERNKILFDGLQL